MKTIEERITPKNVLHLRDNEIYVFGANESFINSKGSAKIAMQWGAIYGVGPECGRTYGICTKDKRIKTLPLSAIERYVKSFINFAKINSDKTFLVVSIGCVNAGYTPSQIAPFFREAVDIENIHLTKEFWDVLKTNKFLKQNKLIDE